MMPIRLPKSSLSNGSDPRPANWDKRVACAYLRLLGATQRASAKAVGVSRRTIDSWEQHETWPDATAEAADRWMGAAVDEARRCIFGAMQAGDAATARWLLERVDPALAPPHQNHHLHGSTSLRIVDEPVEPIKRDLDAWRRKHAAVTDKATAIIDSDPECSAARDDLNRMIADRVAAQKSGSKP